LLALAQQGGYVSVRKMLGEMSLRELGQWWALWQIDPWGEERADLRNAITSYVIAEANRNPKKRAAAFSPRDFMPYAKHKAENVVSKIKALMTRLPKKKG
jgi:hypothetical protein